VGQADTPGFPCRDNSEIVHDENRDIFVLKLKRTEGHMKLTSLPMIQSWRANCDVQILLYNSDPN
jgi:hypothetical protein